MEKKQKCLQALHFWTHRSKRDTLLYNTFVRKAERETTSWCPFPSPSNWHNSPRALSMEDAASYPEVGAVRAGNTASFSAPRVTGSFIIYLNGVFLKKKNLWSSGWGQDPLRCLTSPLSKGCLITSTTLTNVGEEHYVFLSSLSPKLTAMKETL